MCIVQERINHVSGLAHKVKAKVEALDKQNEAAKKNKDQVGRAPWAGRHRWAGGAPWAGGHSGRAQWVSMGSSCRQGVSCTCLRTKFSKQHGGGAEAGCASWLSGSAWCKDALEACRHEGMPAEYAAGWRAQHSMQACKHQTWRAIIAGL